MQAAILRAQAADPPFGLPDGTRGAYRRKKEPDADDAGDRPPGTGETGEAHEWYLQPQQQQFQGPAGGVPRRKLPPLGRDEREREAFERYISPYFSSASEFTDLYFAGMYNDGIAFTVKDDPVPTLRFDGPLRDLVTGEDMGRITCEIRPTEGAARHEYLQFSCEGTGAGRRLVRSQMETYLRMGLQRVELPTGFRASGYIWLKFGALPRTDEEWTALAGRIRRRMEQMSRDNTKYGRIGDADQRLISSILRRHDRTAAWEIADLQTPTGVNDRLGRPMTLGQALLSDHPWEGSFDISNPRQMERLSNYLGGNDLEQPQS